MHPVCEAPGCEEDSVAMVSFFHPEYGGALCKNLCTPHWAVLMNLLPQVLQQIVQGG